MRSFRLVEFHYVQANLETRYGQKVSSSKYRIVGILSSLLATINS